MKAHVFQHAPFEGLGSIQPWLERHAATIHYTRFFAGDTIPNLRDIDLLIAMGGPMSVNDEAELPWLKPEKQAVRDAVGRGTPVLGVCLGAQLVASALGARVYKNRLKEIGWFPIEAVPAALVRRSPGGGGASAFQFPKTCDVMHWHGETFDLPPGAVHLARSVACEHQAFQVGLRVIGLQFHLEMTPDALRGMVDNCRDELVAAPYVQTEQHLLADAKALYAESNRLMEKVLEYLAGV